MIFSDYENDVTYYETTGLYTLKNTINSKIGDWNTDYEIIAGVDNPGYHYTCFTAELACSTITYIGRVTPASSRGVGNIQYIEIDDGKKDRRSN